MENLRQKGHSNDPAARDCNLRSGIVTVFDDNASINEIVAFGGHNLIPAGSSFRLELLSIGTVQCRR
jgi:hypothetical protein